MSIASIVPAYNEEKYIDNVLSILKKVSDIDNIIVVSDGSTDSTAEIARSYGVKVLELKNNLGKGGAMKAGIDSCSDDIILFLDADLIGLTPGHIYSLLEPVTSGIADMSIGVFAKGRLSTDLAQKIIPYLSGQRAVKRDILIGMPNIETTGFGVETTISLYAKERDIRVITVELRDLTHKMKEEKLGIFKGFAARMRMYYDILRYLKLDRKG